MLVPEGADGSLVVEKTLEASHVVAEKTTNTVTDNVQVGISA